MNSIETKLRDLLAEVAELPPHFSPHTDLLDALALESTQVMEFVMEVEDHFDLIISQEKLAQVRNIAQLAEIVAELTT